MKKLKGNLYGPNETAQSYNDEQYEQLPPGLYYFKFCQVKDEPDKEYLYMEYDIAEGDHKGYFERLSNRAGFWGGNLRLYYTSKAENIFKRALKAINTANGTYEFNPFDDGKNADEKTLIGKNFWAVIHEVEYEKANGEIGSRMSVESTAFISDKKGREGNFNKKLLDKVVRKSNATSTNSTDVPDFLDSSSVDNPFA